MLYVLLDNGHGQDTPGKSSPKLKDGHRFYEWQFCREVVAGIIGKLEDHDDIKLIEVTPEDNDISLTKRVNRINSYCNKYGSSNCIMISVHVNAAGDGKWMTGRGWSAWTTPGQNNSDKLADCLYDAAEEIILSDVYYIESFNDPAYKKQKPIRVDKIDGDRDYEAKFQIIRGSSCPAVLTENMFMDNEDDLEFLESIEGFNRIIDVHVDGILRYKEKYHK